MEGCDTTRLGVWNQDWLCVLTDNHNVHDNHDGDGQTRKRPQGLMMPLSLVADWFCNDKGSYELVSTRDLLRRSVASTNDIGYSRNQNISNNNVVQMNRECDEPRDGSAEATKDRKSNTSMAIQPLPTQSQSLFDTTVGSSTPLFHPLRTGCTTNILTSRNTHLSIYPLRDMNQGLDNNHKSIIDGHSQKSGETMSPRSFLLVSSSVARPTRCSSGFKTEDNEKHAVQDAVVIFNCSGYWVSDFCGMSGFQQVLFLPRHSCRLATTNTPMTINNNSDRLDLLLLGSVLTDGTDWWLPGDSGSNARGNADAKHNRVELSTTTVASDIFQGSCPRLTLPTVNFDMPGRESDDDNHDAAFVATDQTPSLTQPPGVPPTSRSNSNAAGGWKRTLEQCVDRRCQKSHQQELLWERVQRRRRFLSLQSHKALQAILQQPQHNADTARNHNSTVHGLHATGVRYQTFPRTATAIGYSSVSVLMDVDVLWAAPMRDLGDARPWSSALALHQVHLGCCSSFSDHRHHPSTNLTLRSQSGMVPCLQPGDHVTVALLVDVDGVKLPSVDASTIADDDMQRQQQQRTSANTAWDRGVDLHITLSGFTRSSEKEKLAPTTFLGQHIVQGGTVDPQICQQQPHGLYLATVNISFGSIGMSPSPSFTSFTPAWPQGDLPSPPAVLAVYERQLPRMVARLDVSAAPAGFDTTDFVAGLNRSLSDVRRFRIDVCQVGFSSQKGVIGCSSSGIIHLVLYALDKSELVALVRHLRLQLPDNVRIIDTTDNKMTDKDALNYK